MTNRYDELSDRARWFLNNFDEIDLADTCASQEASNQTREAALAKVRDLRDDLRGVTGARWIADALDTILDGSVADSGPSVREAAADDRAYWEGKDAGEGA